MPSPSAPLSSLSERLQTVSETLAAADTQEDVLGAVLTHALEVLGAAVGAVLLVEEGGEHLMAAFAQGDEEGAQTLWREGPLDGHTPAGDALERHEPLFFEQEGDLGRAYPDLAARRGGPAAVATAVLPMFLDGRPLGAIILDFGEPHRFTPEEVCFLRILAAQAATALGRAQVMGAQASRLRGWQDSHERLVLTLHAGGFGLWELDVRSGTLSRSPETMQLLGLPAPAGPLSEYLGRIHPDDRLHVQRVFARAERGATPHFAVRHRFIRGDGREIWLEQHTQVERDPAGRAVRYVGVTADITARQQAEERLSASEARFRRMVEASPFAIAARDPGNRLILVNDASLRLTGHTRAEFEAGEIDWASLTPPEHREADERAFSQALEHGASEPYEKEMLNRDGERLPLRLVLIRHEDSEQPLVVGYLQDLRAQRAAERVSREHSAELERQVATRTGESEAARLRAEVLAALGDALQGATSPEEVAELALDRLGPALRAQSMLVVRVEGEGIRLPTLWGDTPEAITAYMTRPGLRLSETPMLQRAAQTGQGVYLGDYRAEPGMLASFPALAGGVEPILLPGGALGGFLVTWRPTDAGPWLDAERDLLRRAAATLALALERAEQARQREEERAALDAFVVFSEAVGAEMDVLALARQATQVVCANLEHVSVAYYELSGGLWKARAWSEDISPEVVAQMQAGVPQDAPDFSHAVQSGTGVFAEGWDAPANALSSASVYGAAAFMPILTGGSAQSLLAVGRRQAQVWTDRERATVRAVARSLSLALERTEQARQLRAQKDAEERRTQALAAFAELSRDLVLETGPYTLIRRTQEVVLGLLPAGFSVYFEPREERWRAGSQVGHATTPRLQAVLDAGLPFGAASNLTTPWRSGEPHYQDEYDPDLDELTGSDEYPGASVTIPIRVDGQTRGILGFALYTVRHWSHEDRAVLETVGRQLTLALERAEQTRRLAVQNAELEARTRALEGFASLTQDLAAQDDPRAFVRRAQEVVLSLLSPGYALYYERGGDRWRNRVQVGETGNADLQAFIDAGPPVGVMPSVDVPWTTGEPFYQDDYVRGSDTPAEMVQHVNTIASLPVLRHGEVVGVLIAVLFEARRWSPTDRVVLETVARSLGGALERVEVTRDLGTAQLRLRAVVDNAPLVLFALDRHGTFTLSEGRGLAGLGLKPGQAVGQSAHDLYRDTPGVLDDLRLALAGQEVHQTRRVGDRVFETWTIPVYGAAGAVTEVVGVSTDVSERRQAEEDLERRNEELRRSNAELEQFAYIASHDLQAPIRAVTSFAGVIDRRYGAQLDDRGRLYLRQIMESGEHMKRLVDDLLALSRVHTEQKALLPVDLGEVCDAVAGRLHTQVAVPVMSVTRGSLPRVLGDAQQLDRLLQNLISNGLKYHREGVTPQVHVSAGPDGGVWRFAIRDNGIGIEPRYYERIFEIFQRLHGREQYEGTGIGLAVCKKIVERHGGRLWLESTPGEGSTFFFTLPQG